MIKRDEFGCELWQGKLTHDGYALAPDGRVLHRVRWQRERGEIPEGMYLDHLCRRRNCIALHHLEPVKQSDNERRKLWRHRLRALCPAKHDLRLLAVITPEGGRVCRECNRLAMSE